LHSSRVQKTAGICIPRNEDLSGGPDVGGTEEGLVSGGGHDHGCDHACSDRGENVVAIDFAPFIPTGGPAQVIVPVVDPLTAIPVFVANVLAFSPFIVVNVVMVVVVMITVMVVMVILRDR
jgi:hypothetical protein